MRWLFMLGMSAVMALMPWSVRAQSAEVDTLRGVVTDATTAQPLLGANVYWLGTPVGVATDAVGAFSLPYPADAERLVVRFVGYRTDTLSPTGSTLRVALVPDATLDEVTVAYRRQTTSYDYLNPILTEQVSDQEFLKAACCNLSESFETLPSADVSFSDAVTGTRQIELLGLAGPYTQITRENMPAVRGLYSLYGLTHVPGPWVSGLSLNKGPGSVVNGYESIAGQIDIQLWQPTTAERLYLNAYANQMGRTELNANVAHRFEKPWATGVMLHGKYNVLENDQNQDGFLDAPLSRHFVALNRWQYVCPKGTRFQAGIKQVVTDERGGQTAIGAPGRWDLDLRTRRTEGWAKIGRVFKDVPWRSLGWQFSGVDHRQDSRFGQRRYDARQRSLYGNFVYQSVIGNTNHQFRTGASFQYDAYEEVLDTAAFDRTEAVPGAYFEYTYRRTDRFSLVAGLRGDYHNLFGAFATPRLHLRYALTDRTVLRAAAGRGQRTANVLADNNGLLASARRVRIEGDGTDTPYGLGAEVAWNYGLNLTQYFTLGGRDGNLSADFYRTDFINQIVTDLDQSAREVVFYNLTGRSFANSFQTQLNLEPIKRLDVRLAYRWYNVRTTFGEVLRQRPFVAAHRAFANIAYATRNGWHFDYTLSWHGRQRIPITSDNPPVYQRPNWSPDFFLTNVQVSKRWTRLELYVGAENLFNYRQQNPIVASDQPFSEFFDASLVWGPIFGRNLYTGVRYRIP